MLCPSCPHPSLLPVGEKGTGRNQQRPYRPTDARATQASPLRPPDH